MPPGDRELEERDSGLARERTSLAWTRTAISFGALGGVVLRVNVATGLIILAIAPLVWQLGRLPGSGRIPRPMRMWLIAASIVGVSLLCLLITLLGRSAPGAFR
jgi:uncharacterized membrane protein YidH (DUF202 family)